MIGDMEIVLYQAAVVLGAIVGFSGIDFHLRQEHQRFGLMVAAAILPGAGLTLAPGVVSVFWVAVVTGGVVALLLARVDRRGAGTRADAAAR